MKATRCVAGTLQGEGWCIAAGMQGNRPVNTALVVTVLELVANRRKAGRRRGQGVFGGGGATCQVLQQGPPGSR